MKIPDTLKLPFIILGLALILLTVMQIRSCIYENRIADSAELEGRLQAFTQEAEKEKKEAEETIQKLQEQIEERDSEISGLREDNVDLETEISEIRKQDKLKEERISELETLASELEVEGDLLKMYENMKAQRNEWRDRFFNERAEKEKIIGQRDNWAQIASEEHQKFLSASEQRDLYKKQLSTKNNLLKISQDLNKKKDKEIRRLKGWKSVERIITVPLAVFGGLKIFGVI